MSKSIKFQVKNGSARVVDVCGAGMDCQALTADIEAMLGKADESSRETTDNFYKPVENTLKTDAG